MLTLREIFDDFALYAELEPGAVFIDTKNSTGESPIHWMASLGDVQAIELLAQAGANLSAQDASGNTALHVAVSLGHAPATRALIAGGTIVSLRNADSQTPADIARSRGIEKLIGLFSNG